MILTCDAQYVKWSVKNLKNLGDENCPSNIIVRTIIDTLFFYYENVCTILQTQND